MHLDLTDPLTLMALLVLQHMHTRINLLTNTALNWELRNVHETLFSQVHNKISKTLT